MSVRIALPLNELEFGFARSSGPGGQNVNKVNSKCILRWPVRRTSSLPLGVLARFLSLFGGRLTSEGELVISSDRFRDQRRNQEDCISKAQTMLDQAATPPAPRKATKPSRSSRARRVSDKRARSATKALRGRAPGGD